MLSVEDNELVTNTNKGTPMGELFRRFWIPVALSEELPGPDCVPVKLKILNEDLIAFRDSEGRVGLIDAFCPHRGAPMFFGRNEEWWPALRLPRLEVRRHRSMRRPAEHARRRHLHEQDQDRRLPLQGVRWHGLRLHGPEGQATALPGLRLQRTAGIEHLRHEVPARVQLAAGDRRRLRPEPRRFPAQHAGQQRQQPGVHALRQPGDPEPHRSRPAQLPRGPG